MDVEYMSLVSSLEMIIVFGWAVPILVLLYGVTIFGYWCVYAYWFNNANAGQPRFMNRHTKVLQPVTGWLLLALVLQHVLASAFFWCTQSVYHGCVCVVIAVLNLLWFVWCCRVWRDRMLNE